MIALWNKGFGVVKYNVYRRLLRRAYLLNIALFYDVGNLKEINPNYEQKIFWND